MSRRVTALRAHHPVDADRVTLRDLRPDDNDALDTLMSGLSARSRYLRFHAPIPALSGRMRRALLDVDGHDRIALLAQLDDGTPIGIARVIREHHRPDEAEIAVAVVDSWQRRGIAQRLVTSVAERARAVGVRRLTGRILAENRIALRLFRAVFPVVLTRHDDDVLILVALLEGTARSEDWTITIDDILTDLAA